MITNKIYIRCHNKKYAIINLAFLSKSLYSCIDCWECINYNKKQYCLILIIIKSNFFNITWNSMCSDAHLYHSQRVQNDHNNSFYITLLRGLRETMSSLKRGQKTILFSLVNWFPSGLLLVTAFHKVHYGWCHIIHAHFTLNFIVKQYSQKDEGKENNNPRGVYGYTKGETCSLVLKIKWGCVVWLWAELFCRLGYTSIS